MTVVTEELYEGEYNRALLAAITEINNARDAAIARQIGAWEREDGSFEPRIEVLARRQSQLLKLSEYYTGLSMPFVNRLVANVIICETQP